MFSKMFMINIEIVGWSFLLTLAVSLGIAISVIFVMTQYKRLFYVDVEEETEGGE